MMSRVSAAITLALLAGAAAATAEDFRPNTLPELTVRRAAGAIVIDGELDDPGWRGAARAGGFAETNPGDNIRPLVPTEVRIAYDDENLYVAIIAHDDPALVRARLHDRDEMWSDDAVGVMLDTFGDGIWCYELFANPLGIQGDGRMMEGGGEDMSFDLVWHSEGRVTERGFQVEMAVPFGSLRFPDRGTQTWRVNFWRNHPRETRHQYSWVGIDRGQSSFLNQFGTLRGLDGVRPGRSLELMPTLVAWQTGFREDGGPDAAWTDEDPDLEPSLGLKYSFGPSLSLEATLNPDFSQVESDAAQIDVNSNFALFFPELRPFFLQGSDLFDSFIDAIHTRSINNPLAAAKLSGRAGATSFLALAAYEEDAPFLLPFEEASAVLPGEDIEGLVTIARVKHSLSGGSFVGGLITDRRLDGGGANTAGGLDANLRLNPLYSLEGQILASRTEEPDDAALSALIADDVGDLRFDGGRYTAAFDGERFSGTNLYLSFERDGRHLSWDVDWGDASPAFRADNGFVSISNRRELSGWVAATYRPNRRGVEIVQPILAFGRVWNWEGERKDEWLVPQLSLNLTRQTWLEIDQLWSNENYRDIQHDGIRRTTVQASTHPFAWLDAGGHATVGRTIFRFGDPPFLGRSRSFGAWLTLRPTSRLTVEPELDYARMRHPDGDAVYTDWILRTRLKMQFTRRLFLRLVLQYEDLDYPWYDYASRDLDVEPLLSYKLNAFTVFYAGSTHALHRYREAEHPSLDGDVWKQDARQFFVKVQYLFQS
ncbi:MAG: carbohydrate binding family 9 domain-containing protein [Candidatus Krumholzibacteriota bacterium]|nr:carbohydrate binding family 9 domain-containing protein [Candidatus Krumholzibacteriota bacterium]